VVSPQLRNHYQQGNLAQNDPKDPFGATIWQRFGEAIKHLCLSIFEIMI
jgi:hypothetical protein